MNYGKMVLVANNKHTQDCNLVKVRLTFLMKKSFYHGILMMIFDTFIA